jgi:hypothetical protein
MVALLGVYQTVVVPARELAVVYPFTNVFPEVLNMHVFCIKTKVSFQVGKLYSLTPKRR